MLMNQQSIILTTANDFGVLSGAVQAKLLNLKWNVHFIFQVFSSLVEFSFLLV